MTGSRASRLRPDAASCALVLVALLMIGIGCTVAAVSSRAARRAAQAHAQLEAANLALIVGAQLHGRPPLLAPLAGVLRQLDLGPQALIALIADDATSQDLRWPAMRQSGGSIAGSAMFRASRVATSGVWNGVSAQDGRMRIHAFRRLAAQGVTLAVGIDRGWALRPALAWRRLAWGMATGRACAIALATAMACWALRAMRRHTEQLAAEAARLRAVLAGMSDGLTLLDSELRLILWNERFAAITRIPRALLRTGVPMRVLVRERACAGAFGALASAAAIDAAVAEHMRELLAGCESEVREYTRADGTSFEMRRRRLPQGGFISVYTDTTERRHNEAAQAEMQRLASRAADHKARFAAFVSHEIRTPLSALLGSLALLDRAGLAPAQQALADSAHEAGAALLELVQDVLEMSALDAGHIEIRPTEFAWRPMLAGVLVMFGAQAEARGIRLAIEVPAQLPPLLHADATRLRQVLTNLVANAVKFASPGRVLLRATAAPAAVAGAPPLLRLAVLDRGPQLPEHAAALLFQPFSRLESARAADIPGTGLGLAVCARLVQLMGGEIGVRGSADGGNEFWLTLPLPLPLPLPQSGAACAAGAAPAVAEPRPSARVLLVEDMAVNRRITAALLLQAGHRVTAAADGTQAIDLVRAQPFDLVFMDLSLPRLDGCAAAQRIRMLPGAAGRVGLVALTAAAAPEDRARCRAAGFDALLCKPASLATLTAAIRAHARHPAGDAAVLPPTGSDALDLGRLRELRDRLPAGTLAKLMQRCLAEASERLDALRRAVAAADAGAASAAAHVLAGLAANYGLPEVERAARRVDAAAQRGDLEGASGSVAWLEDELARAALQAQCFVAEVMQAA